MCFITSNPTGLSTHLFQIFKPILHYLGVTEFSPLFCDELVLSPLPLTENSWLFIGHREKHKRLTLYVVVKQLFLAVRRPCSCPWLKLGRVCSGSGRLSYSSPPTMLGERVDYCLLLEVLTSCSFSISPGTLLREQPYSVSVQTTKRTGRLVKIWEEIMDLRNLHELWHELRNWAVSCQQDLGGFALFLWKGCCSNLANLGVGLLAAELLALCELWLIYHLSPQHKFCRWQNLYMSTLRRHIHCSTVLLC